MSPKWLIMLKHSEYRPNCVWFSKIYGPVKIKWKKRKEKKRRQPQLVLVTLCQVWIGLGKEFSI